MKHAPPGHGMGGIINQIDDHLLNLFCIDMYFREADGEVSFQLNGVDRKVMLHDCQNFHGGFADVHIFNPAGGTTGKFEKVRNDMLTVTGLLLDNFKALFLRRIIRRVFTQQLAVPEDDPQRSIDFVDDAGGESADGGHFFRANNLFSEFFDLV